jgi:hypothetical protein
MAQPYQVVRKYWKVGGQPLQRQVPVGYLIQIRGNGVLTIQNSFGSKENVKTRNAAFLHFKQI